MDGSIRLGRILGIPILIHYMWVIVFGLVAWSLLATGYFPMAEGGLSRTQQACPTVDASRSAYEALMLLTGQNASQVFVRHRGRFAGIITREDLLARIRTRLELEEA